MMDTKEKAELVAEFCQLILELRYRLRKMFQVKLKEADIDISFEVLEIMKLLLKRDGMIQQELADVLFKDKSNMTYLIDNMVKAGWVTRKEDESNRRIKLIFLTEQSRELNHRLAPLAQDCFLTLAKDVRENQVKSGIEILSRMNSSLLEVIV
ncbi:DNA-binding transcriptional regulator, MarR family [Pedobacter westerhofensis]|uniref:DNA-binding transcriptional regulator, MarR family n=1 Tax=Pedobacter westerhofensis TaxID=425512 RepID=A0A521CM47_9SPHI|nr:MarR family transcriptional regulator [Pedobacter westerhofensis]SMO60517.1 DNA-binding transcriptional regulator, MarR family [Pedobacter westerhofensis]